MGDAALPGSEQDPVKPEFIISRPTANKKILPRSGDMFGQLRSRYKDRRDTCIDIQSQRAAAAVMQRLVSHVYSRCFSVSAATLNQEVVAT